MCINPFVSWSLPQNAASAGSEAEIGYWEIGYHLAVSEEADGMEINVAIAE